MDFSCNKPLNTSPLPLSTLWRGVPELVEGGVRILI